MSDTPQQFEEVMAQTQERYEKTQEQQEEFLNTLAEEETDTRAARLETQATLTQDHTVQVTARLNGELMDRLGAIDQRLESLNEGDGRIYEASEAADDASQLLADIVDDSSFDKELFYQVYEKEGIGMLGTLIERVLNALNDEQERLRGGADGFR